MEVEERARVIKIAKEWERTPYRHMGRVKGSGADCIMLLAEVFHEAGLIPKLQIPFYPQDWMHHRNAEKIFNGMLEFTREIPGDPQPGDLVIFRYGRCFSHAAIVLDWPTVIHACVGTNVQQEDVLKSQSLCFIGENTKERGKMRPRKFFSYWGK